MERNMPAQGTMADDPQIPPSPGALRLLFVGDVMLGRLVNELLRRVDADYPWGDTKALLRTSDWRACNLECVISNRGRPWAETPKAFHFRSDAKNVAVLKAVGIDAVSIANNHVLDFEYDAMLEMLGLLDRAGIHRAGAGAGLAEATRPAISKVKGTSIGLIAFTDNEPQWEAGPRNPGVFYLPVDVSDERAATLFQIVRETRKHTDLVIVSAHWGPNWGYEPLAAHVRFAHALIDAGADIIFGHSGHVFQGVELFGGRPIMYCTGNFVDDYAVDEVERNDESFVFMLEMDGAKMSRMMLRPTVIADCQARMARGERARAIALKMARLCERLGTPARWREAQAILEIRGAG
jgi:poly-gamma-glutamate capsule biosynthesis protein CapA/YwtB (metallophosphatase superfamily)